MAKLTKAQWEARRKAALDVELPPTGTLVLNIGGSDVTIPVMLREFSSGSRGYGASERATVVVDDAAAVFQASINIVQVGSGPFKA